MNLSVVLLIIAVVVVGIGAYFFSQPQARSPINTESRSEMEKANDQMMQKDTAMEADAMMEVNDEQMMEADDAPMMVQTDGSYEAYAPEKLARAQEQNVVLFFRASWCPTCRALDADLKENRATLPSDLVILDVNYDTEAALKQKYGVTYQHTLVQVDAEGNLVKKWTGSMNVNALAAEVI